MRTTLVIDDALLRRAKQLAARRGLTLSALVERALREELSEAGSAREQPPRYRMQTFGDPHATEHHEPADFAAAADEDDATRLRFEHLVLG